MNAQKSPLFDQRTNAMKCIIWKEGERRNIERRRLWLLLRLCHRKTRARAREKVTTKTTTTTTKTKRRDGSRRRRRRRRGDRKRRHWNNPVGILLLFFYSFFLGGGSVGTGCMHSFFSSILWCGWIGDHLRDNLTRFGTKKKFIKFN